MTSEHVERLSLDYYHAESPYMYRLTETDIQAVGGGYQAYSRLSTTHGHITDCKLDSVVYVGVCV